MTDFNNQELNIGDEVVFAFNRSKTTKLQFGVITKVNIKQAKMIMAKVMVDDFEVRVAGWNIYKLQKDT